jgi:UDP-N-acetylglucosamine 2-epimerase (non-hydrolysing)
VLGSMIGRSLRTTVAHIEGGLRSYDLRHPFPEELNRKLATALSSIHYAPGSWAASNLRGG